MEIETGFYRNGNAVNPNSSAFKERSPVIRNQQRGERSSPGQHPAGERPARAYWNTAAQRRRANAIYYSQPEEGPESYPALPPLSDLVIRSVSADDETYHVLRGLV
jgi:hypothetical protein